MVDRLSIRARPPATPIMWQTWAKLLFLHWAVPVELLRPLIPPRLTIDTWEDSAWVSVTPFTMWGLRPTFLPPLPWLSQTHELNVRTYVHLDGVPGVWFFSLDAANLLAVLGARVAFSLPYYRARMSLQETGPNIRYRSERSHPRAAPAEFSASWMRGEAVPEAVPGSRDFFLVERYCLYTERRRRLYRARIFHRPWPLCGATLVELSSTMLEASGIPTPDRDPIIHQQREPIEVGIWRLQRV